MKAIPVDIDWHPGLPIFASESFLKAVGDEYGWLGGIDDSGNLRCILPYTIIRKAIFRMVRFRVETIYLDDELEIQEEKSFLNNAIQCFRDLKADMIIPATTNTIFRTYPDGADAAPYGSWIIDLTQSEEILWKNIKRITRQNINTARKKGVTIRSGFENLKEAYLLVQETFKRSNIPFMNYTSFERYVNGLGEYGLLMVAECQGVAQSYVIFAYSKYCAYAIYAGNVSNQYQGANKLLYWEAIRHFHELGVQRYDFVGARIDPEKGSKQAALSSFKKRFGAELKRGYMWKYSLNPIKYYMYGLASRFRSGGDIVDAERYKMQNVTKN